MTLEHLLGLAALVIAFPFVVLVFRAALRPALRAPAFPSPTRRSPPTTPPPSARS